MVEALPVGCRWSATGIGRSQFVVNVLAIAMGEHVRVGLEGNLWMDRERQELATNARFIEQVAQVANVVGRGVASPGDAALITGLNREPGKS